MCLYLKASNRAEGECVSLRAQLDAYDRLPDGNESGPLSGAPPH